MFRTVFDIHKKIANAKVKKNELFNIFIFEIIHFLEIIWISKIFHNFFKV